MKQPVSITNDIKPEIDFQPVGGYKSISERRLELTRRSKAALLARQAGPKNPIESSDTFEEVDG